MASSSQTKPSPGAQKDSFPKELKYDYWHDFDKKFLAAYLLAFLLVGGLIYSASLKPANNLISEEDALKLKERYARLVLNEKPEPKDEAPSPAPAKQEEKPKEEKPEVDRKQETTEQKQQRRQEGAEERAEVRQSLAREIEETGLFAELSAAGEGGELIDDVLGRADAADLGNVDLSAVDFGKRPTSSDLKKERRGERVAAEGLGTQKIEKAKVKTVNTTGDVKLAAPQSVEGAGSADASRSAKNIQSVISKIQTNIKLQFEKFLRQEPDLAGQVDVEFVILADGSVNDVRIVKTTLNHDDFERRLISMIRRLRFPPASGDIKITYPFVFTSTQS